MVYIYKKILFFLITGSTFVLRSMDDPRLDDKLEMGVNNVVRSGQAYGQAHLRALLEQGADPNAPSELDGMTPLMAAASGGYLYHALVLLDYGAMINPVNEIWGMNSLHTAIANKRFLVVRALVEHDNERNRADLSICTLDGRTALDIAYESEDAKIVYYLTNHINGKYLKPPLREWIIGGADEEALEVYGEIDIDEQDAQGNTPLIRAVAEDKYELVQMLMHLKASKDIQNNDGYNALALAVEKDRWQIAELLVD